MRETSCAVFSQTLFFAIALFLSWQVFASQEKSVLWVWDRPDNLNDLNLTFAKEYQVAPLLATIHISESGLKVEERHHSFLAPDQREKMGVLRIDTPKLRTLSLANELIDPLVFIITAYEYRFKLDAIQLDFDAKLSERKFYDLLLKKLRSRLQTKTKLSITAIASWFTDRWWKDSSVDEIVFMFYPLRASEVNFYKNLLRNPSYFKAKPKISVAFSVQDPMERPAKAHRVFWFNHQGWN